MFTKSVLATDVRVSDLPHARERVGEMCGRRGASPPDLQCAPLATHFIENLVELALEARRQEPLDGITSRDTCAAAKAGNWRFGRRHRPGRLSSGGGASGERWQRRRRPHEHHGSGEPLAAPSCELPVETVRVPRTRHGTGSI